MSTTAGTKFSRTDSTGTVLKVRSSAKWDTTNPDKKQHKWIRTVDIMAVPETEGARVYAQGLLAKLPEHLRKRREERRAHSDFDPFQTNEDASKDLQEDLSTALKNSYIDTAVKSGDSGLTTALTVGLLRHHYLGGILPLSKTDSTFKAADRAFGNLNIDWIDTKPFEGEANPDNYQVSLTLES